MRAAVTGGAGFIGHHIVAGLLAQGDEVRVVDDLSTGRRSRLDPFAGRVQLVEANILDPAVLDRSFAGCDVVFHDAAIASVARSLVEPRATNDVNVNGTIEVVLAAAHAGVRRVIVAGSSAVYGLPVALPCREDQPSNPLSPYGASKLAAEHYAHTLGRHHGVETVVLRYFNVYGAGQDPAAEYAAVVPRFITAALEGQPPVFNGTDEITRDYVHIDDVVEANLVASRVAVESGLTCNIASGSRTSLRELLSAVGDASGREITAVQGPPRPGDIPHSHADISLARRALGFEPTVSLADGIARTMAWYRTELSGRSSTDVAAG